MRDAPVIEAPKPGAVRRDAAGMARLQLPIEPDEIEAQPVLLDQVPQSDLSTIDRTELFGLALGRGKLRRDPLGKGTHRAALSAGARKNEIMAHVADID